jgi:hypothetical protein
MDQRRKTPDDSVRRPSVGAYAMNAGDKEISTVDRFALAAMFAVTLLVLATFKLTVESPTQPIPAAATAAMSSYAALPVPEPDRRLPRTEGRH